MAGTALVRPARSGADWTELLADACGGSGLTTAYQPIVDVARGVAVGYEALARFEGDPFHGAEAWFAAARALGWHVELEVAALRSALAARADLPANCFLAVNVSPDLLTDDRVRAVWREQGDLGGVIVELTEQAPVTSYAALEDDLAALRAAGAFVAVDDAGAGYAGLRHLLVLRPALIKLDRELVRDVDVDEAKRALVEMVGTFADRVDAWLLAEGVERDEELDVLVSLGVPLAQGYLLGRPGAPWPAVDPAAGPRLAARRGAAPTHTVRDLLEPVPTAPSLDAAAGRLGGGRAHTVVVVDDHTRPVALCRCDPGRCDPGRCDPGRCDPRDVSAVERGMRVNVDTPVRDALARALTRGDARRFEPLLCTDGAGRFLGVVRLERMIRAALD